MDKSAGPVATAVLSSKASTEEATAPLEARQGRHQQRFDSSGARLVAGAIPIRTNAHSGETEVLMIRSTRGEGLIFPKARAHALEVFPTPRETSPPFPPISASRWRRAAGRPTKR